MKETIRKLLKYLAFGIVVAPASILTHELGHFLCYWFFGADNVRLLAFSVSADKDNLSSIQLACSNMIGPLITYVTLVLAAVVVAKGYRPFWVVLGLSAPVGRVVNFVYIYFRLLGYSPNPNFDEYNFSRNLGIEPLFIALPTAILVLGTFWYFGKKAWQNGRWSEVTLVVLSVIVGICVWSQVGPLILH